MLNTVQDYLDRARTLLQDKSAPFRYTDEDLVAALNTAMLEARRLRPDLFRSLLRTGDIPEYTDTALAADVELDVQYRAPVVYYMVGYIQMIDEEDVSDERAAAFLNKFTSQLLTTQA